MKTTDQVYKAIIALTALQGYPPTIREIQKALHLNSTSVVHYHLMRLAEQGRIKRALGKARGIRVIDTLRASG